MYTEWMDSNLNKNIWSFPFIGHKTKDIIFEHKKEYEHLQSLNHKFKKNSNSPHKKNSFNHSDITQSIEQKDIKDYIDKTNEILSSIAEILNEKKNYEWEIIDFITSKEIDYITNKILSDFISFSINIKEIIKDRKKFNLASDFDINASFNESQLIVNYIKQKLKKMKVKIILLISKNKEWIILIGILTEEI